MMAMRVRLRSRNIFCHESVSTKVSAEMTMKTSMMKIWDPMIYSMAGQVSQVSVYFYISIPFGHPDDLVSGSGVNQGIISKA